MNGKMNMTGFLDICNYNLDYNHSHANRPLLQEGTSYSIIRCVVVLVRREKPMIALARAAESSHIRKQVQGRLQKEEKKGYSYTPFQEAKVA